MLSKRIKKIIASLLCVMTLFIGGFSIKAYANPNVENTRIEHRISKGRILIYHSHTCEKNIETSVSDVGADLKLKLEKKGYMVEHITDDFSVNYNSSYYRSKDMLMSKDLSQYDLIIDLHFDAGEKAFVAKDHKDQDVAKLMMVNTKLNPHLENETKIGNKIKDYMKEFGSSIMREHYVFYNKGINFYNLSMNENMLLIEVGNNQNIKVETQRSMTYLAASIDNFLIHK